LAPFAGWVISPLNLLKLMVRYNHETIALWSLLVLDTSGRISKQMGHTE
jgi:hypothetical protein